MNIGVMQPYFFPYIGYFQLIGASDVFVVYDNIKYTKKGWINRNRMLQNGSSVVFSIPLKRGSDSLDVRDRELASDFNRDKLLNQFGSAYRRAPYFNEVFALMERILCCGEPNLFGFLYNSLVRTCEYLGIITEIRVSSDIDIDHGLRGQDRVLALCGALGAKTYINAIGGTELYTREAFAAKGIELKFIKSRTFEYRQFGNEFVPWLSIIDVMMFNPIGHIREYIGCDYELI